MTWTLIPVVEGESPPPGRSAWGRGEDRRSRLRGPEAPTPAAPKLPGDYPVPQSLPQLEPTDRTQTCGTGEEPRASSVRAPPVPYLPIRLGAPPTVVENAGPGPGPRKLPPVQAALGLLRGLFLPCLGQQRRSRAEDQTAGGAARQGHGTLLRDHRQSPRRRGASSPAPRSRSGRWGRGFSLTHCPLGLWRYLPVSAARNFPPRSGPTPPPPLRHPPQLPVSPPGAGDPLFWETRVIRKGIRGSF